MAIELTFTEDPAWFLARAADLLAADPALTTVVSTYTRRLAADPSQGAGDAPRWWVLVHEDGALVGAAMRTMPVPPYAAYVLPMSQSAALALARAVHGRGERLLAVNGCRPAVDVVAGETARLVHGRVEPAARHRLHLLGDLVAPHPVEGSLRLVREDEVALAEDWISRFHHDAEVQAGRDPAGAERMPYGDLVRRIDQGLLWCWEVEGVPVHLTGTNAPSDQMVRVGPVYTPAELRGRGYASAGVHAVSALLRERGSQVCLFTDLDNRTSNKVYAALGFAAYADTAFLRVRA